MPGFPLRLLQQLSKHGKHLSHVTRWQVLDDHAEGLRAGFTNRCDDVIRNEVAEAVEREDADETKSSVDEPRSVLTASDGHARCLPVDVDFSYANGFSVNVDDFAQS